MWDFCFVFFPDSADTCFVWFYEYIEQIIGFSFPFSAEVLVLFNYDAQADDELTIRKGDVILDVNKCDGGWWEGQLGSKRGVFPDNFVTVSLSS